MNDDVEVTPQRAAELLASGEADLIDVRTPPEWAEARIEAARHVELAALGEEAATLDPQRPVMFVCRVGNRSAMATQAFRASGRPAYNVAGGIEAWIAAGLPVARD